MGVWTTHNASVRPRLMLTHLGIPQQPHLHLPLHLAALKLDVRCLRVPRDLRRERPTAEPIPFRSGGCVDFDHGTLPPTLYPLLLLLRWRWWLPVAICTGTSRQAASRPSRSSSGGGGGVGNRSGVERSNEVLLGEACGGMRVRASMVVITIATTMAIFMTGVAATAHGKHAGVQVPNPEVHIASPTAARDERRGRLDVDHAGSLVLVPNELRNHGTGDGGQGENRGVPDNGGDQALWVIDQKDGWVVGECVSEIAHCMTARRGGRGGIIVRA